MADTDKMVYVPRSLPEPENVEEASEGEPKTTSTKSSTKAPAKSAPPKKES